MPVGTAATVKGADAAQTCAKRTRRSSSRTRIICGCVPDATRSSRPAVCTVSWRGTGRFSPTRGGFQVFSLEGRRKLDDDGVTFRSHIDGSEHRFTPENVIAFQEALGVDVAMVLDVCVKLPASREALAESVRLHDAVGAPFGRGAYAGRDGGLRDRARRPRRRIARTQRARTRRARFPRLRDRRPFRRRDARRTLRDRALRPPRCFRNDKPRYLMGVGTVRDLLAAVDCGIDHVRLRLSDALRAQRPRDDARRRVQHLQRRLRDGFVAGRSDAATAPFARRTRARTSRIFSARRKCSARACSHTTTSTCSTRSCAKRAKRSSAATGSASAA